MLKFIAVACAAACSLFIAPAASASPAVAYPGAHLVSTMLSSNGHPFLCTLGFVVRDSGGGLNALTAGHCNRNPSDNTVLQRTPGGDLVVGDYTRGVVSPGFRDAGLVSLTSPDVGVVSDVDGRRVSRILAAPDLRAAPDLVLCKSGARTGVSCGPVTYVDDNEVRFRAWDDLGDSGSPVYALLQDGTAGAVGILYAHSDDAEGRIIHASMVAPVMWDWGLSLG